MKTTHKLFLKNKKCIWISFFTVISLIAILYYYNIKLLNYEDLKQTSLGKHIVPLEHQHNYIDYEILNKIHEEVPQLPRINWNRLKVYGFNQSCAMFPKLTDIMFNNQYWQTLYTSNGTFYLYGAYIDDRIDVTYIRVLAMIDKIEPNVTLYGHLWYPDGSMAITYMHSYNYIWHKYWGHWPGLQPHIISFILLGDDIPMSISLVENKCDNSTTNVHINYKKPKIKKDFAVCVKGLDFLQQDHSIRLIEWIELLRILGADKIFIYNYNNHHNIEKVLDYYQSKDIIEVIPYTLGAFQPNTPFLREMYMKLNPLATILNELIPYNDCLYKHMYEYKYVTTFDVDEIIIPRNVNTWKQLIKKLLENDSNATSFCAENVYFLDSVNTNSFHNEIPEYMHILQHVKRTYNFTNPGYYIKCFHDTNKILTLHNHYPISCLSECNSVSINVTDGQLNHYRKDCIDSLGNATCTEYKSNVVEDFIVWKYKDILIKRVQNTLDYL